jgi:hypothetical protein
MVRSFLNGRFENTAFCLLSPDGKQRLSRSGRAPWMAFNTRRGPRGRAEDSEKVTVAAMEKVASKYKPKGDVKTPIVQDFHSFRQALNVASGDQRLLLFVSAQEGDQEQIRKTLSPVMGDTRIVGRFHTDFMGKKGDENWVEAISGVRSKTKAAIFVIQSGKFGQKGSVVKQLPIDANAKEIKTALLNANGSFAKKEKRKVYSDHVAEGRRKRIYFEGGVEYGEDRDGDGKIDFRGGGRRPGGLGDRRPGGR